MSASVPSRYLVTINGRVPTQHDLVVLHQSALAVMIFDHGACEGIVERAEFAGESHAVAFHEKASRAFPEDDVRLWASVAANSLVADLHAAVLSAIESADWEPGDAQRDLQRLRDQYQAMFPADTKER